MSVVTHGTCTFVPARQPDTNENEGHGNGAIEWPTYRLSRPTRAAPTSRRREIVVLHRTSRRRLGGDGPSRRGENHQRGDLTIDGNVEGSIELGNHSLTIGVGASVKADLTAKHITISGSVTGNVRATDMVDLRATGSVDGDIMAPRLLMADGATAKGHIEAGSRGTSGGGGGKN